jgi:phenylalanyl-tRNA synthetase beta chain
MLETGQPIHAFDFELIEKAKIIVQRAQAGEKFQTLDEKAHVLQASDLLICDGERAVALAGVMGGLNSEVSSNTRRVLIECAYFDPLTVAAPPNAWALLRRARRFERGTDPNGIPVINRAAQLMQQAPAVKSLAVWRAIPSQSRRLESISARSASITCWA